MQRNTAAYAGDGYRQTIKNLLTHHRVNQVASDGELTPTSLGAESCFSDGECRQDNPYPNRLTSNLGLQVDHAIPSNNLNVVDSGVYWPAHDEQGRLLINDARIDKYGEGKDVSSDHRMVWIKAAL